MAVVRGAVYAGLDPNTISARVSRRAYGIKIEREFETGVDPESMRVRLPSGDFCKNRFHPLITKGRRVNINSEIVLRLVIANSTSSDSDITIYSYNDNQSPPRYINDPRLKVLARIDPLNVFSPLDQHGIEKQATFKMFFGLSEIKAILEIDGVQYDTTLQFDSMSLGSSYVRN
ncbi:Heat shock 70 kDa protein 12A [Lunasporangiospora selenospora]|uniref:Heat shock 70 kDa protein 12A n=1 Tax=Lunasporangiospora selenospora TaxID=979761 RepID=A0A9P6G0H8_9FUNG|nr:Heat shock 70 kDa protein 12A [Lunasporangiospora selenospora]